MRTVADMGSLQHLRVGRAGLTTDSPHQADARVEVTGNPVRIHASLEPPPGGSSFSSSSRPARPHSHSDEVSVSKRANRAPARTAVRSSIWAASLAHRRLLLRKLT